MRKRISAALLALLLLSLTVACGKEQPNTPSGGTSGTPRTDTTTERVWLDTATGDSKPEPAPEIPDFSDALISSFDFTGDTDKERLSDKATNGSSGDTVRLVGDGCALRDSALYISDAAGSYAMIEAGADSDFSNLGNTTLACKVMISDGVNNSAVAGILSQKGTYTLYFSNGTLKRRVNLSYHVGEEKKTLESLSETPVDVWRVFAITTRADPATGCGYITVWRSTCETPTSGKDFEKIFAQSVSGADATLLRSTSPFYLGRRYGDLDRDRGLKSVFRGIKLYNQVLSTDQLATIVFDSETETVDREYSSLTQAYAAIEAVTRDAALSDWEWSRFEAVRNRISRLLSGGKNALVTEYAGRLPKLVETLRQYTRDAEAALDDVTVIRMTAQNSGLLERVPMNNGINIKLQAGMHSFPLILDYDHDGDDDLIIVSYSSSYSGVTGGGTYLFRNSGGNGNMVLDGPEYLFTDAFCYAWVTYLADGSPIFSDADGVYYTGITSQGFTGGDNIPGVGSQFRLYDVNGDGLLDVVTVHAAFTGEARYDENGNWLSKRSSRIGYIPNTGTAEAPEYLVKNRRYLTFADGTDLTTSGEYDYIRSFAMADWDGDGDPDIIAGGWMNEFYYYRNVGTATEPKYERGVLLRSRSGDIRLDCCRYNLMGYDWDHDGGTDLIVGSESGDVMYFRFTGQIASDGMPIFEDVQFFMTPAVGLAINALCRPTSVDWDGDGDEDLIVGDNCGFLWLVENITGQPGMSQDLSNPSWALPVRLADTSGVEIVIKAGPSGSLQGTHEAEWGYTVPMAADWDGDGDFDLLVNSVTGRVVWFENVGTKTAPSLAPAKAIEVEWKNGNVYPAWQWWKPEGKELVVQYRSTVYPVDMDSDGLCDLVTLDSEGYLVLWRRYRENGKLLLHESERVFRLYGNPVCLTGGQGGKSGRIKFVITDWNGDGMPDVIVGGTSFDLYLTTSVDGGIRNLAPSVSLSDKNIAGHNHGFTVVDWNRDGIPDIVSGTEGGYFYYLINERSRTNQKENTK